MEKDRTKTAKAEPKKAKPKAQKQPPPPANVAFVGMTVLNGKEVKAETPKEFNGVRLHVPIPKVKWGEPFYSKHANKLIATGLYKAVKEKGEK
jgi:hypothetical protein